MERSAQDQGMIRFPKGSRVRVVNYPLPTDPRNLFNWNGKVGIIKQAHYVGRGLNDLPVYQYEVFFEKVEIPVVTLNQETKKLDRSVREGSAQNFFEESYLEQAV